MSACWMSLIKDEPLKRRPMRAAVVLLICVTRKGAGVQVRRVPQISLHRGLQT